MVHTDASSIIGLRERGSVTVGAQDALGVLSICVQVHEQISQKPPPPRNILTERLPRGITIVEHPLFLAKYFFPIKFVPSQLDIQNYI